MGFYPLQLMQVRLQVIVLVYISLIMGMIYMPLKTLTYYLKEQVLLLFIASNLTLLIILKEPD